MKRMARWLFAWTPLLVIPTVLVSASSSSAHWPFGVIVTAATQQRDSAPYRLVENWPQLPADDPRFGTMSGVAVDAKGIVYGVNRDRGTVWMWDKSGTFLGDWGIGVVVFGHDIEYDPKENVMWLADRGAHTVKKYALDGKLLMTIGLHEAPGDRGARFNGPSDVAIGPNGDIFVSDGYWNSRVVRLNKDGKYLDEMGTPGRAKWQFGLLHHITLSASGRMVIDDLCGYGGPQYYGRTACSGAGPGDPELYGSRMVVIDTDFNWIDTWPLRGANTAVGDVLYVWSQKAVVKLDVRTGKEIESIPVLNPTPAHQIAVAADGDIYTADENLGGAYTRARLGSKGSIRRYTRAPR